MRNSWRGYRCCRDITFYFRYAPVEDEDVAKLADHDVGGCEVAVDDIARVCIGNRIAYPQKNAKQLTPACITCIFVEPPAVYESHYIEGAAIFESSGIVNGDNAGMLESRQHSRL